MNFPPLLAEPQLSCDEVHVVRVPLDGEGPGEPMWAVLDEDERRRAGRFVREIDRRRFVIAHAATRDALGRYLREPAESLRFVKNAHGKPSLAGSRASLQFNLAHSGELALVAVSSERVLGVDIEAERPVEALNLAQRFFSPSEHETLLSYAPGEQLAAFYRCWTRKESFIKALGIGLSFPLSGFDVSLASGHGDFLRACPGAPIEAQRWRIDSIPIDAGYAAALTAAGKDWRVRLFNHYTPPRNS